MVSGSQASAQRITSTSPRAGAGFHGVMLSPWSGWMKLATSSAT
jgi:hypothetical protein